MLLFALEKVSCLIFFTHSIICMNKMYNIIFLIILIFPTLVFSKQNILECSSDNLFEENNKLAEIKFIFRIEADKKSMLYFMGDDKIKNKILPISFDDNQIIAMDTKKWAFEINLNNLEFNAYRYIKNLEINTVWEPVSHKVGKCKFLEKLPKK